MINPWIIRNAGYPSPPIYVRTYEMYIRLVKKKKKKREKEKEEEKEKNVLNKRRIRLEETG